MNESMKRERAYRMQTLYRQSPNNISHQPRKIAVLAILLFALSGLVSGFAVGAFVHPGTGTGNTSNTGSLTTPGAQKTETPVTATTLENVNLDEPVISSGDFSYVEVANGSTSYTFSALIIEKNKHPIQVSDVTCKLWVTKDTDVNSILAGNNYAIPRAFVDNIQQPFPNEITDALNFISPTQQQTQPCTPNGKTTWNYAVSPSVDPGTYSFVVLADWKGKHYNWSWVQVKIKKAD